MNNILKKVIRITTKLTIFMKGQPNSEYSSFEEAIKQADGYEDNILTKVVVTKGKKFAENLAKNKQLDLSSLRTFIGLASTLNSNKLTVLDFGGAAGTHYFIARSILSKDIKLDWRVVETNQMTQEAKKTRSRKQ